MNHLVLSAVLAAVSAPLVVAADVDRREHRVPDRLVAAAALPILAVLGVAAAIGETSVVASVALGSLLMATPIAGVHVARPSAMGFGDVKLALVLGAGLGVLEPRLGLAALTAASAATASWGLLARRTAVPFAPGLVGASMAVAVVGLVAGVDRWT